MRSYRARALAIMLTAVGFPAAAAAQSTGGVPNIEGPWQIIAPGGALTPADGGAVPFSAAGLAAYQHNRADLAQDPIRRCLPPGVPRLLMQPFPFNIVQGRSMYGMMFEWNHLTRVVYLRPDHTETVGPLYLGESIGHWDGSSFVVDSNSFKATDWLDDTGVPVSYDLHIVERFTLLPGGARLEDRITITDPDNFTHPWTAVLLFQKQPDRIIKEDYCLGRMGLGTLAVKNSTTH